MNTEQLFTEIILALEANHLTTKAVKKPKGTHKALEVRDKEGPLGRIYLRPRSVHVRVRGAPKSRGVSTEQEALDLLMRREEAPEPAPVAIAEALAAFGKGDFEEAGEKARAVLAANPQNDAARRLVERCEKILGGPEAPAPATETQAEVAAPPTEEPPEAEEAAPAEPEAEVAPPEEPLPEPGIEAEAPAPEEVTEPAPVPPGADEAAVAAPPEAAAVVVEEAPPEPPAPRPPTRRRTGWVPFALLAAAAAVIVLVVFSMRGGEQPQDEEPPPPPEPTPTVEEQRRARIAQMASLAQRSERAGRFWGNENSAGALYAALLSEASLSPTARVGAVRVADTLLALADTAFADADYVRAASQYEAVVELTERCLETLPADTAFRRRSEEAGEALGVARVRIELFKDMAFVPGGSFYRGDNDGPLDSRPRRRHSLNAFWIDRFEVTNRQYRMFVQATGHRAPPHWSEGQVPSGMEDKPVVSVTWRDASAFAQWAGKRLPAEAEWEKAARGEEGLRYPWGPRFASEACNTREGGSGQVARVGSYPSGASPYGVTEMAGNVREWTADYYDGRYYVSAPAANPRGPARGTSKVVRGGSYLLSREWAVAFARSRLRPDERYGDLGFRCASSKGGPAPLGDPAAAPPG